MLVDSKIVYLVKMINEGRRGPVAHRYKRDGYEFDFHSREWEYENI